MAGQRRTRWGPAANRAARYYRPETPLGSGRMVANTLDGRDMPSQAALACRGVP
jgi:hypothetical protein